MRTLIAVIVLVLLGTNACDAAAGMYAMWLSCHPQAIAADSHSSATITAEVRDSSGATVADKTIVDFTTSLGIIERSAETAAGVARVRLESGNATGTALISAVVRGSNTVAQLRVDFLEPGTEMFDESFISVSSEKHLGYDVDLKIVDSAGGVTIYHRGLTINAEDAQIDIKTNTLRARGRMGGEPISIQRGKKTLQASALNYSFTSMNGVLLAPAEEGAKRMLFRGRDLFIEPDKDPKDNISFEISPIAESKLFIRAKSLVIRPGEVIKLKRANYYIEGDKMLSVPLQVVSLKGGAEGAFGGTDQMLTYGTEGLRMSLPVYYSLTPNGTGAIRLKHEESTGWGSYSGRPGWQVDIDQDYNVAGSARGTFSINRVTTREWGMRWNQRTEFDNDASLYTYLDFPGHRDLYGMLDYSRSLRGYNWAVSLRGNKYKTNETNEDRYSASTYLQSRARPLIGDAVNCAFTTRLSYNNHLSGGGDRLGTGLGMQLYGKPLQFGTATNLSTSLTVSRDWGSSNAGTTVYGNASLFRMLGMSGQMGLNYSYAWSSQYTDTTSSGGDHRLSANLNLRPSTRWSTSIYAIYGLTDGSVSAFGDVGYTFLPTWRLSYLANLQRFTASSITDWEIALCKLLGRQEARLSWSQSRKRFRLDFSAAQF